MVSKNNIKLKDRYATKQVPHYGIRKLSVGVASVLLSTTLYMGVTAHADTIAETDPQPTIDQPTNMKSGTSTSSVTTDVQPTAGQLASNGANTPTGNATTDVQSKPTADQSASMATNSATPKNEASAKAVPTVLPKQPANATAAQSTAVTSGSQPATNFNVESDNNGLAAKPTEQSADPAALMTNFAVIEQPVDDTNNSVTTTLPSKFTWAIHYTDESGKKLLPDSVITHDYTRTDTGDQMGNWSYVSDSVKVTGTPNAGSNIDNPTFKFDQAAGGTTFDFATWYAAAASIDGYTPNYGSVVLTDQLPKNPESLHATSTVDSGTHEFTFIYTKQPTKVTINYVDDEQSEKVVGTGTVSGKTGTEVTITPQLPKGYMLTPDKDVPSTYTVTDDANQAVTIHVQKQFVDLSATDLQAKQTRTVTLHYVYGAGDKQGQPAFDDAVLDVYYHRTAILDRTTNQTTYGDWMWDQSQGDPSTPGYHVVSGKWTNLPQSWANVTADVPSIKGYYADLGQNDPKNTNHVPSNTWVFPTYNNAGDSGAIAYLDGHGYEVGPTHTIKYMPNQTTVTVNYVDDDNNGTNVGHQSWNGTTGQHISLTLTPPDNYALTPGWVNPTSYDFDGVNSSWYTVHVKHKTLDVTDQEPKDQVTKVTRLTRNHLYGDGPHKGEKFDEPDIFDLALKRTATKDLVTNKITFGDWQVDRDNSKNVQGSLWIYPDNSVGGSLRGLHDGYSYLGRNTHQEFSLTDGSTMPNTLYNYGWRPDQALKYSILNEYYGPDQVKIPIYYVDADTGQKVAEKINGNALTGDNFRDGNTVTIDQNKLSSLPTTLTGYQLLPGQTLPTSYKIDTFAGVKAIEVQVVKNRSVKVTFVDDDAGGDVVGTPITITGHTGGDPVALKLTVPDKYQLADGQQLPTSYTFTKGSGDLTIHLKHQVVQREATIDVRLGTYILVHVRSDNRDPELVVIPQTQWAQLDDKIKNDPRSAGRNLMPSVAVGTLTGHVNYDLVNEEVVSLGNDWTSLNLGGKIYQMPEGTDVVNGVTIEFNNGTSEKLREELLKYNPDTDPDYVNRPWYGYLSVNATNNDDLFDAMRQLGLQAGLVGDDPNALAKATGDRAATSVEMGDKTIDLSWLQDTAHLGASDFSEQNGQLQAKASLLAVGVYIPYVEKTATRTIKVTTPDGKTTTVKQTATLAKQIDFADNAHPAWTTGEWASYDAPTIPGYTASQSNITKETVTGTTEDQTVNITYTANPQTTTVVYQTEDGTSVHTTTVNCKTGQTVTVPNEVPAGWYVVNGEVPSKITFGSDGAPKTVVTIGHSHVTVTSDAPKTTSDKLPDNPDKAYPGGVGETDLNKTVTRTIKVTTPDGQTKTITQTAKLTRTADVDEVTGEVKYSDWTTGNWSSYTAPNVPGYTASQSNVAQQEVTDTTKDQTIDITYTANDHQISVEYVDNATGQVLKTDHVSGKTGQTVSITPHAPDGWELVSGQSVPSEVTLGADGAPATVIKVQPQERSVAVKFVDDQSFDPDVSGGKAQVGQAVTVTGRDGDTVDLKLTVPDKYQLADGQQLPTTYTFKKGSGDLKIHLVHKVVQREAAIDIKLFLETLIHADAASNGYDSLSITQTRWKQLEEQFGDEIKYGPGGPDTFSIMLPSVEAGALTGHVSYDLVDNRVVSLGDDWTSLNLDGHTYQLPNGTEVVNGVMLDDEHSWGKKFKEEILEDSQILHVDTDPDYANLPWHGYLSVNATNNSDDIRQSGLQAGLAGDEPNALAKAIGDRAATAVEMSNKPIDFNFVQQYDLEFNEQDGQLRADVGLPVFGVYIPYVEKTATRTIKVTTPDGKTTTVKQTATLAKQVDFGKDAHPDWTTGEWSSYEVPTIPGYTASQSNVAKETVTGTTNDQTVNITYTANPQTTTVVYQTEDGTPVHTTTVNGHTGQTVKVPTEVPVGWRIVNGKVPSEITFEPNGTPKTVVTIAHSHVTVAPDAPKTTSDKLPDNPGKTYPAGVGETDLNKTVTRTIKVTQPNGTITTKVQTVKLTRTATVDEVTGEVTYGKWSTGQWDAYKVPAVAGYTATQTNVATTSVNEHTTDQTVNVNYTPNKQTTTVKYVDDKGKVVHTTTVDGVTDQTVKVPSEVPAGWMITKGKVPSEITFGADGHEPIVITVGHQHVTVDPNYPQANGMKLPDNPAKTFNGVEANDLNKTITRTIKVTTPDGQTKTVVQTAKLTRMADVDEVTGEVTYGKWTTGEWNAYEVPSLSGYTASQTSVEAAPVDENTKNQAVEISYTPNKQSTTIKYVDDKGDVVHTTTVTGVTDQTVKVPDEVPAGWTITKGKVPSEITFGADGHEPIEVTVAHQHVTVTSDHPQTNGIKLPDNPVKTFNGVETSDLNKTITRTIKVTTPDGKTKTVSQTAKLTRTADVDEVTGEVTYSKWTTSDWNTYEVPALNGYTASQTSVEATPVDENTKDQTVEVNYTPNKQTTTIKYVDDKGQTIHTTTVNGLTDQTVKVPSEVPAGWMITKGKVPSEVTFGADGHEPIEVTVVHQHVTVDSDHPQNNGTKLPDNPVEIFNGVETSDLNKTITRTIKVTTPDGKTATTKQEVKLTRTADVDEVTGEVIYSKWTTGEWNTYEVPVLNGYTASQISVEAVPVDENTKDQTVEVSYTPNKQSTMIKYVDDKGQTIHTTTVNGVTDQAVKVPSEVPAGWMITKGKVPSEITFGADGHEPIVITVGHQHVTVDPNYPQNNGTELPDNPAKTFNGVEANDLNKTITRTIKVTTPDGKATTTKQTAKLTRTADVDEVTGEVTYSAWTTGEWAAYDAPSVSGYAPSQVKVNKETVTSASKDTTTTITYLPTQHQISVEYVDDDDNGKVVKTDQVPGKTDQTITVTPSAPTNYDLVDSNNRTYTVTSADGQTVQIHVKHHQVKTNESKTVTRTINVHTPHDGVKTVKQTATLNRDVTTDQVTGEKTYGNWTTGQWDAYTPKVVPGYTLSTSELSKTNVDGSSSDQTVDVTYTADAQKVEIVYVDDAKGGAVVKTDQVAGKTDETVKVTPDVPAGYKVVGEVSGSYTLTANGHQTITVHLVHQTKTTSEDKTVTRTINVHTPHDGVKTIKQTAKLTRDVIIDQVTGEKTYGDWSATLWDHYAVPAVAGYVPSIKQVAQQVVNGTTTDQTINVTYTSGEHTTHINYVDGDGNIVHTTTIKGQTDGTSQVPNETPAGWMVVGEPVPTELAFGPDGHTDVTVTVSHKHVTVTPDQSKTSTDKLPDNPAKTYPNGVGHDDLNKTITRTIKVTTPDGQTKTVAQIAKLTRTANVDEVTGVVTYGNWTTGEWSSYDVSTVPGYTPSQSEVPTTKVTDDTKDQTVTVTYTADDQATHINYVDGNGKIVHTTTVTGKTDQTVKVPNEVPTGWTITDGRVPSEVTFGAKGHDDVTVTVDHQHVTVTPDKPQTDGTKLPDNPSQTFHGVSEADLNKVVTRTIEVASPARKTTTVKQTAKLTRTADVDEVTGEVTYGKWTTGAWSSYSAPTVPGYTPSQAVVAESAVYADTTDQTVKITYTADSHTTHINYVDENGNVVHTTTVTGQTDQTVKVPNETPAGWMITTGQVPSEVTFGPDGYTDVTITVDHRHVTVTPDDPKTDGSKLPDNPALTFHDVDHDDLNKTVTRTIKLNVPGRDPQVITQTAHLTRTATVDEVTGEVTYGDWTSGQWDAYEVPAVDGYTASQTTIPAVKVTSETTSQEIVIDYVAVPTAQTTPSNNQTDENQVTPEKVANGTVQETKPDAIKNSAHSTMQDTKQLPQTGNDNRAGLLSLIGSSLMAGLAFFGLGKKKKYEN